MLRKLLTLLILVLLGFFQWPVGGAAQDIPGVPSIENDKYVVRLIRFERFGSEYGEYTFTFTVENRLTKHESLIQMHNLTTHLQSAEIVNGLFIIFGKIQNTADVVTILDLEQAKEKESILCYGPRLSETKKYIIYQKFYPRFADAPAKSSLVLVYDLQSSTQNNLVNQKTKFLKNGNPEDIGHPVFPEENVQKQTTMVWVEPLEQRHFVNFSAGYLWLESDSKVLFVDKYNDGNWLVLVDLSDGFNRVKIRKKKIEIAPVLALDPKISDYTTLLKNEERRFAVNELRRSKDNRITVSLRSDMGYKYTTIEMTPP